MKTLTKINSEYQEALRLDVNRLEDSERNKHEKHVKFLKDLLMYLETEPNEDFLKKEAEKLKVTLKIISDGYPIFFKNTPPSVYGDDSDKAMAYYNKMMRKATHSRHLKNIEYILE